MPHTEGPWVVIDRSKAQSPWIVGTIEGDSIADCEPPGPWMSSHTADANARLVAAAPDLLAVLRAMSEAPEEQPICAWYGAIKGAIRKATESK